MPRLWAALRGSGGGGGPGCVAHNSRHDRSLPDGLRLIGTQAARILLTEGSLDGRASSPDGGTADGGPFDRERFELEPVVLLVPDPYKHYRHRRHDLRNSAPGRGGEGCGGRPDESPPGPAEPELDADLWDSRFMVRGDHEADGGLRNARWGPRGWFKPSCIPISLILVLIVLVVLWPLLDGPDGPRRDARDSANAPATSVAPTAAPCGEDCRVSLVESIPIGLKYPPGTTPHLSTQQAWLKLIAMAEEIIEIASFYWSLQQGEVYPDPSSKQGEQVFQSLFEAGTKRNISIFIAQNKPSKTEPNIDTEFLASHGAAQVRSVDFERLMGGGVLHTKLWIIDRSHVYLGSANMDWRSLSQVKELGVVLYNCSCLANDIGKIFDVYWTLGQPDAKIPGAWPDTLATPYNAQSPLEVTLNGTDSLAYVSSSPPSFCPGGRSTDLQAILNVIEDAEKFIYISVMDYIPMTIYTKEKRLWMDIDNALRTAAINRKVHVRLLISLWNHTRPAIPHFLHSLEALSGAYEGVVVEAKMFVVPSTPDQQKIPFARVNHNKYMVTDKTAYIGTSNWSGDYFITTGGAAFVVKGDSTDSEVRSQLQAVFDRDWNSSYAQKVPADC